MSNLKIKNLYVCESIIIAQNGQPSLINLISSINSNSFPAMHPKITVLVSVSGDIGKYNEKIELVSLNNNKVLAEVSNNIEIKESGRNNFIGNFINTIFPEEGKYWFRVSIDGEILSDSIEDSYINLKKI